MISIIIPLYNQSRQLDRCLESIKNQIYENYEIIVVNDRSTQKLSKIINKWKDVFGINITFLHNTVNHGAPYSRNKGYRHSKGEYIIFCDADVTMKPEMLEEMLIAMNKYPEISFVYSSFRFGFKIFKCIAYDSEKLKQMPFIHSTSLIRRKDYPKSGWDEKIKRLQDWDLWLTMLENEKIGIGIDKILFSVEAKGTMSTWLPKITYKIFPFFSQVEKYNEAVKIIKDKHNLN